MTNTLRHFRNSFTTISKRIIRVNKKKLYFSQRETIRMYAKDDNKARLTKTLYVFNLRVNLLSKRRICQKDFYEEFNKNKI